MRARQPHLPTVWLVTDARNDAALERIIARLPRGSGVIFRHYHLDDAARRARFDRIARLARARGHVVVLGGTIRQARRWRADGTYGANCKAAFGRTRSPPARGRGIRLVTAHNLREIAATNRARADAVVLSPVFPTRSHPGGRTLGPVRFRLLAGRATVPVIALGGMNRHRARAHRFTRWAAIDGLMRD